MAHVSIIEHIHIEFGCIHVSPENSSSNTLFLQVPGLVQTSAIITLNSFYFFDKVGGSLNYYILPNYLSFLYTSFSV